MNHRKHKKKAKDKLTFPRLYCVDSTTQEAKPQRRRQLVVAGGGQEQGKRWEGDGGGGDARRRRSSVRKGERVVGQVGEKGGILGIMGI